MRHHRHYTLEQAMAVRGWVAQRVGWVRAARARLAALGPHALDAISGLDLESGGAYPGREVARSLVELSRAAGELEAVDIVLRDIDRGLIDFPALRRRMTRDPRVQARLDAERGEGEGVEVYLCWLIDEEDAIRFWHEPDAGFAGRRPI
jgi:Uncharacterized conserved protein (DUF2203)